VPPALRHFLRQNPYPHTQITNCCQAQLGISASSPNPYSTMPLSALDRVPSPPPHPVAVFLFSTRWPPPPPAERHAQHVHPSAQCLLQCVFSVEFP
jgi:hypothetical protein